MSDQLMTVEVDTSRVLSGFQKLGDRVKPLLESAAYQTALAVKARAQALFPRRKVGVSDQSWTNVVIQKRNIGGYVVMTGDVVGRQEKARRQRYGTKNARSTYHQVKHVGLWLEFGTRRHRRYPWLFPAADAEEGAHLNRIANALARAVQEADL
jgi:hypothetical protein